MTILEQLSRGWPNAFTLATVILLCLFVLYCIIDDAKNVYFTPLNQSPDSKPYASSIPLARVQYTRNQIRALPSPNCIDRISQAGSADDSSFERLIFNSFSKKNMRKQQPTLRFYADLLTGGMKKNADKGSQNMVQWFNWMTFDIISRLAFRASFSCLDCWQTHPCIKAIFSNACAVIVMQVLKGLKVETTLLLVSSSNTQRLWMFNSKYASDKLEGCVKRSMEQSNSWDNVLKDSSKGNRKIGMNIEEVDINALRDVIAGSGTIVTLLLSYTYQLIHNPSAMAGITSKIRSASDDIDCFNSSGLNYTTALLDETIYPPVPTQVLHVVPKGGGTVGRTFLPEGTTIRLPQYAVCYFSSHFTRLFEFYPERFFGTEEYKDDAIGVMHDNSAVLEMPA